MTELERYLERSLDYLAVARDREEKLALEYKRAHSFAEMQRQIVLDTQYAIGREAATAQTDE
jgi:hypothetical protein